ncbi:MAG: sulfotransferase family protein [Bacteroidota bacterium]
MSPLRVCLWSSPRNVSTALMYSFAQRPDTQVYDEPLYPHFLRVTGAPRPDREATMGTLDTDGERVVRQVILGAAGKPVHFFKLMPHFLVDLDRDFLDECQHVLLTRDPGEILASYTRVIAQPTMLDIGMAHMHELYRDLQARNNLAAVIDAEFVLRDPPGILAQVCARLGIPFYPEMLNWEAGPRPEDGPWAAYWYHAVHASTGFKPYSKKTVDLPEHLHALHRACQGYYEELRAVALR